MNNIVTSRYDAKSTKQYIITRMRYFINQAISSSYIPDVIHFIKGTKLEPLIKEYESNLKSKNYLALDKVLDSICDIINPDKLEIPKDLSNKLTKSKSRTKSVLRSAGIAGTFATILALATSMHYKPALAIVGGSMGFSAFITYLATSGEESIDIKLKISHEYKDLVALQLSSIHLRNELNSEELVTNGPDDLKEIGRLIRNK